MELYQHLFKKNSERCEALVVVHQDLRTLIVDEGFDGLLERIKNDDAFVKQYRLEALRETLDLDCLSYILTLAMSVGKTMLIGSIVATAISRAVELPGGFCR